MNHNIVFFRDKKGGPNGGDGGRGGSIFIVAKSNYTQYAHLKHHFRAKDGGNGAHKNRHGKNAQDLMIEVQYWNQKL